MDTDERKQLRNEVQSSRRGPAKPALLCFNHDSQGELSGDIPHGYVEITIEPTDPDGALCEWFDDRWWMDVVQLWADDQVTIYFAPTPLALLHPVVLYQVEMLRRVCTRWRVVGYAYANDVNTNDDIEAFVASHYNEVRFIDEVRSGNSMARRIEPLPLEKLLANIRTLQVSKGATHPVLVRMPAGSGPEISRPTTPNNQATNRPQTQAS